MRASPSSRRSSSSAMMHGHEAHFTATYAAGQARAHAAAGDGRVRVLEPSDEGDGQDHHAGALDHAFLPLHGLCRSGRLRAIGRAFFADLAQDLPPGDSRTWRAPAAAICNSTRWPWPCCAIRTSAPRWRRRVKIPTRSIDHLYRRRSTTRVAERARRHEDRRAHVPGQFSWPLPLGRRLRHRLPNASFKNCKVSHFLLEYDTARAGDFRRCVSCRRTKGVVLGLISSKTPVLERIDDLQRRSDEAAQLYRPRSARHRAAVRVCLDRCRQSADRGRRTRQTAPGRWRRRAPSGADGSPHGPKTLLGRSPPAQRRRYRRVFCSGERG